MRTAAFLGAAAALFSIGILVSGCPDPTDDCDLFYDCSSEPSPPPSCKDEAKNGNEADVDCGGDCGPTCQVGQSCNGDGDCVTRLCAGGHCGNPAACDDGIWNGDESDMDCGGKACAKCGPEQTCRVDADCTGNECAGGVCKPNCADGVQNNQESAVDCGGPNCQPCGPEQTCGVNSDCTGNECVGGVCKPNCADGVQNNQESAVDCGGPTCPKCGQGQPCLGADGARVDGNCASGHCVDGVCCDSACDGECQACSAEKTGGQNGVCAPVAADTDPDDECDPEPPTTCGNSDGTCSGQTSCKKQGAGMPCGDAASCTGATQINEDQCDGQGACVDRGTTDCAPYACGGASCKTTCASHGDCESHHYCSGQACNPKKGRGQSCTESAECFSEFCMDGVCCNNACDGTCESCNLPDDMFGHHTGTCTPIPTGQDPDSECPNTVQCNGRGECTSWP